MLIIINFPFSIKGKFFWAKGMGGKGFPSAMRRQEEKDG